MRNILLSRYPELAAPPASSLLGLDTPLPPCPELDWSNCAWNCDSSPSTSDDISNPDVAQSKSRSSKSTPGNTWADVALWIGAELMESIRGVVETELGYTTSAGIAHNKILAKLCAGHRKPRAQTVLRTSAVAGFLRPTKFQKVESGNTAVLNCL